MNKKKYIYSFILSWISEDIHSFHNSAASSAGWGKNRTFALTMKPKPLFDKGMKSKTWTEGDKPVSLSHPLVV